MHDRNKNLSLPVVAVITGIILAAGGRCCLVGKIRF